MLTLSIPEDKQAIIEQASQLMGLSIEKFIINQIYQDALNIIQTTHHTNTPPIFDLYKDKIEVADNYDLTQPTLLSEEWDNLYTHKYND